MGLILFALCLNFLSVLMETATAGFFTAAPQCCFPGLFYFAGWVAVTDHSAAQQITAMSPQSCPDTLSRGVMCPLKARACPQRASRPAEPIPSGQGRRELSRLCAAAEVSSVIVHLPLFVLPWLFRDAHLHHAQKERTTTQNKKQLQVKQGGAHRGCWGGWALVPAQGKQV